MAKVLRMDYAKFMKKEIGSKVAIKRYWKKVAYIYVDVL